MKLCWTQKQFLFAYSPAIISSLSSEVGLFNLRVTANAMPKRVKPMSRNGKERDIHASQEHFGWLEHRSLQKTASLHVDHRCA